MKGPLVASLLFFVVGSYGAAIQKCHLENLESCADPLTEFKKEIGQKFPTTEEHVDKLCTQLDKAEKCMQTFRSQCMTPMQTELMQLMSEGAYELYDEFCSAGSKTRTDYLEHAPCMNDVYSSDEFKGFVSYVEAGLEEMMEKPQEDRLPTVCCGYQWLDNKSKKLGTEKCGEDAVHAFNRVASMAASNLPEVLCQGFDPESKLCAGYLPPPGAKPKGTIRNSHLAQSFSAIYLD